MAKPSKVWLITDTHFNHDAMIHLCGRPENHTELLLKNWQRVVNPQDITIHIGDVIFKRPSELEGMMSSIAGKKFLVLGNHDNPNPNWYMKRGFDFAGRGLLWHKFYFSHEPVQQLPDGAELCIHGHWHNNDHREEVVPSFNKLLAVEDTDYKPDLISSFSLPIHP